MKVSKIENEISGLEILQGAFLNGAMMPQIDKLNSVYETRKDFFKTLFLREIDRELSEEEASALSKQYSFMNAGHMAGLMYCLILVPKELSNVDKENPILEKLPIELFTFSQANKKFNDNPQLYLLRYLRNAIAHVNFVVKEIDGVKVFTFWNIKNKQRDWEASITLTNLNKFLSILGRHFWSALPRDRT